MANNAPVNRKGGGVFYYRSWQPNRSRAAFVGARKGVVFSMPEKPPVIAARRMLAFIALVVFALPACAADEDEILSRLNLPEGFRISVYARVPGARSLAYAPDTGTLYVGSRGSTIHAVRDRDGDGEADQVTRIASGLHVPNGLAWRDGRLYVALQDRVVYWRTDGEGGLAGDPATIFDRLPDKRHHGWRYAAFGPDGRLYVTVGAPCNICAVDGIEGTIIRMGADGGDVETVARGVRNSVGLDWQPGTGVLHFTDNGGDNMGDDIPPDELNRVDEPGAHFGFPYLGGANVRLTGFEDAAPPPGAVAPVVEFQAHVAALGIRFYDGDMFPAVYRGDAFVAQHGSWNRSVPVGYRVMRVRFEEGRAAGREVFADGWLRDNGEVLGRPVDVLVMPDGALLVSDDHAGLIYRIGHARRE